MLFHLPIIRGVIDRRILVNFTVDPAVAAKLLPRPFRPKLVNGIAVAGICLIRLKQIRPRGWPAILGISSENAAHRIGVTTIVLPRENEKDLADIPKVVLDTVTVELVEHVDEVLKIALAPPAPPPAEVAEPPVPPALGDVRDGMTH